MNTSSGFQQVLNVRRFSTTIARAASTKKGGRENFVSQLYTLEPFKFDDTTSLGHLRMEKMKEAWDLVQRVEVDRKALRAQSRPFLPPTGGIRITNTIDLTDDDAQIHSKRVLLAAVSSLPLTTPESIRRLKVLAGPRWSPGRPGASELQVEESSSFNGGSQHIGQDGWVRIGEQRFKEGRMNRKSAGDMLDRLVEAANDPNSPLPADTPIDMRYLHQRQAKKHNRQGKASWRRSEAITARPERIGRVAGFPVEWLPEEVQSRLTAK